MHSMRKLLHPSKTIPEDYQVLLGGTLETITYWNFFYVCELLV